MLELLLPIYFLKFMRVSTTGTVHLSAGMFPPPEPGFGEVLFSLATYCLSFAVCRGGSRETRVWDMEGDSALLSARTPC